MQQVVGRRAINHIWHFTRVENLASILAEGIVPRSELDQRAQAPLVNDAYRFDRQREASCFSIGHPNYKMFYSLRMQHPGSRWAVVACHSRVLWLKDCAFCHENAASNSVTAIPIDQRKGENAFERMFSEIDGKPTRAALRLTEDCPTNPQAEVLVFGTVEPVFIVGAVCADATTVGQLSVQHPNFQFVYHRGHFMPRGDYAHWQ